MPRWLTKRGAVWHYRFSAGGRDFSGSTEATDLPTAKLVLEEARRQAILMGIGQGKAPTLGAVIDEWMAGKPEGPHKRAGRQSREALGDLVKLPVDRMSTPTVQGWVLIYLQSHSPASTNLVLRYLKLWCRYALTQKLIREFPYQVKPLKVQQKSRPVASLDLLDKMAGKRNPQIRAALALCMMTGLRESELLQARWEWVKDGCLVIQGRTKSRKIRTVPLAAKAIQELKAYAGEDLPRLGLMFPGEKGKPHKQGWLRQALERSGIPGLGMHRLRATFATLLLRAKNNPKDIQEMLGHQDIRTTMIYAEGSLDEKRKMQEELWA